MFSAVILPLRPSPELAPPTQDVKVPSVASAGQDARTGPWGVGSVDVWPANQPGLGARMFARTKYSPAHLRPHNVSRHSLTRSWQRLSDEVGGQWTAGWRADAGVTNTLLIAPDLAHWEKAFERWAAQVFGKPSHSVVGYKELRQRLLRCEPAQRLTLCRVVHHLCASHLASTQKRRTLLSALLLLGECCDWSTMAKAAHHVAWQRASAQERVEALAGLCELAECYPAEHSGWAHCQVWFEAGYIPKNGTLPERLTALQLMLQTVQSSVSPRSARNVVRMCREHASWSQYDATEQWRLVLRVAKIPQSAAAMLLAQMQQCIGRAMPCAPGNLDRCVAWLDRTQCLHAHTRDEIAALLAPIVGKMRNPAGVAQVVDALLQLQPDELLPMAQALRIGRCAQLPSELLCLAVEHLHPVPCATRELVAHIVGKQLSCRVERAQLQVWIQQATDLVEALTPWLTSFAKDVQCDVVTTMTGKDIVAAYQLSALWAQINPDTISLAHRREFLEGMVRYAHLLPNFNAPRFIGLCTPILTADIDGSSKLDIISRMMVHPDPELCRQQGLARAQRRHRRNLDRSFSELAQDDENVMRHDRIAASWQAVGYLRANAPKPKIRNSINQFGVFLDELVPSPSSRPSAIDLSNAKRVLRGKRRHGDLGFAVKDNEMLMMREGRVGVGEIFAWVWQGIERYVPSSHNEQERVRDQANMRHSLVLALAQCIESDDHRVCAVGISQRLLQVLQSYYPVHVDVVTPQARLCALTQEFANMHSTAEPQREQIESFYNQAMRLAQQWFTGVDHQLFLEDLSAYLGATYDWTPTLN